MGLTQCWQLLVETRFLKGPGLYFGTHLGLFLDRLDPKAPTGGAFGRTMGAKVGSVGEALKNGLWEQPELG